MTLAQLMELTAERFILALNGSSANMALTMSWQSSKVPSMATLWTFVDCTVVICRR